MHPRVVAFLGVAVAIAVTSTMDARGLSAYSALPLFPLMALFWYLQRLTRAAIGLTISRPGAYATALLHPAIVIGAITALAVLTGAAHAPADAGKAVRGVLIVSAATFVIAIVTEEGFFRGWLWASLRRAGFGEAATIAWTSIAFAAWHWSAVVLPTGFNPPPAQVPLFLVNAAVIGAIWGMLRSISGSIVVTAFVHGIWNGLAYVLYGYGTHVGVLGVANTALFGPEIGVLGLLANVAFAAALWPFVNRAAVPAGAAR